MLVTVTPSADSVQPDSAEAPSALLDTAQQRKRVLIIDDDAQQRQLFKTALANAGYEIFEASDGQAGIQAQIQHNCDLIVTDIFMPRQEGLETILKIRKSHPEIKIIAISGGASIRAKEVLIMAKHMGAHKSL